MTAYAVVRDLTPAPIRRILGHLIAYCRLRLRAQLGTVPEYGIIAGYNHRRRYTHFDDTGNTDNYQEEVYEFAATLMRAKQFSSVYDVGCGSGYKLLKYFSQYDTTGFDLEKTVRVLEKRYPQRKWLSIPYVGQTLPPADLVICADVIEHVLEPDELLEFIVRLSKHYIIISTPARELIYGKISRHLYGPPHNVSHIREWTCLEFATYLKSRSINILEHRISNKAHGTQMVVATVT